MIVEVEEDSRDFTTVCKNDYLGKQTKRPTECRQLPRYPSPWNILNGPYKRCLNTQRENQSLPEKKRSEDPIDNLNRVKIYGISLIRGKFPHLRNALPEAMPNENIIECEEEKLRRTVYQLNYSKELGIFKEDSDKVVSLPQDWFIPETVQKCAYRNLWLIATKDLLKPPKIVKPSNNLDPNFEERKILRVTTGSSEYIATIGTTGETIMLRNPLEKHIKLQKSIDNSEITELECSRIRKQNLVLPSKIF